MPFKFEKWVYGLNPMAGVVEGFRWVLLGKAEGRAANTYVEMGLC